MYYAEKQQIQQEKHTFILLTDSISEISMSMGLFDHIQKFNIEFPEEYELISQIESPDRQYLKTIYTGNVEFFKPKC